MLCGECPEKVRYYRIVQQIILGHTLIPSCLLDVLTTIIERCGSSMEKAILSVAEAFSGEA